MSHTPNLTALQLHHTISRFSRLAVRWRTGFLVAGALTAAAASQATTYSFATLAGVAAKTGSKDGSGGGANLPLFYRPTGLALNSAGNLYVTDAGYGLIREVTPTGEVTTIAGTPGLIGGTDGTGINSNVSFNAPQGPAVDSAGNLYVADYAGATIRKITRAGVVTTLDGTASTIGSTDGTGSAARFYGPSGTAVDSAGNVYVADSGSKTIRKITSAGVVTTFAGTAGSGGNTDGTGSAARFNYPRGLAIDSAGNVYVSDCSSNVIRKITSNGVVTTIAGAADTFGSTDGAGTEARFNFPNALAVDGSGNLYVADENNHVIRKISAAGVVTTLAGLAGTSGQADGTGTSARFNQPTGVSVDGAGNVYVTDYGNQLIRKVSATGVVTTIAGVGGASGALDGTGYALNPALFNNPSGIALSPSGSIFVADTGNNTIRAITSTGTVTTIAGSSTSTGRTDGTGISARFTTPVGIAVDGSSNIYVADTTNHLIRRIDSSGAVSTFAGIGGTAGSADGSGTSASFNYPSGVAIDASGSVYVADYKNHTIRKITAAGLVTTLAGTAGSSGSADGSGSAARFNYPRSLSLDSAGNIYVADSGNHTIRKVTAAGFVTTLAGTAGSSGSADGSGSAARFDGPAGLSIDGTGNLYVADTNNSTIRMISPDGVVTTVGGLSGSLGSRDGTGSNARFNHPTGLVADSAGSLYITDTQSQTIRLGIASSTSSSSSGTNGSSSSGSGSSGSGSTGGSGSGSSSSSSSSSTGSGTSTNSGASTAAGAGYLLNPGGIVSDGAGGYYVADTANNCIKKIATDGTVTVFAGKEGSTGSADGTGSAATFNGPTGIALDSSGNLYVSDTGNATIRTITSAAVVTTLAGSAGSRGTQDGTGSAALFSKPAGIVYNTITAISTSRIRSIAPSA